MRNPDRIKPFLEEIEKQWSKVSEWRFGQFIENFKRMTNTPDLFFIEDDRFIKELKKVFEEEPAEVKE